MSEDISLKKWDDFFHWHPATKAVRNRKTYFKDLLKEQLKSRKENQPFNVLNIASGPCRDVLEFFEEEQPKDLFFDCVEADLNAILHATRINYQHLPKITFHKKNIFRFKTDKQYDLIWSAGLFDYFNDKMFTKLIANIAPYVKPGGEIVIGNFADTNPTLGYMEVFLGWYLHHRSKSHLKELATNACGTSIKRLTVEQEPEGVNLFIRIQL